MGWNRIYLVLLGLCALAPLLTLAWLTFPPQVQASREQVLHLLPLLMLLLGLSAASVVATVTVAAPLRWLQVPAGALSLWWAGSMMWLSVGDLFKLPPQAGWYSEGLAMAWTFWLIFAVMLFIITAMLSALISGWINSRS